MVLKATLQKESPKQSLLKITSEATVDVLPYSLQFYVKETSAQVFFCEFCEIFTKCFCYRRPLVASVDPLKNNVGWFLQRFVDLFIV